MKNYNVCVGVWYTNEHSIAVIEKAQSGRYIVISEYRDSEKKEVEYFETLEAAILYMNRIVFNGHFEIFDDFKETLF